MRRTCRIICTLEDILKVPWHEPLLHMHLFPSSVSWMSAKSSLKVAKWNLAIIIFLRLIVCWRLGLWFGLPLFLSSFSVDMLVRCGTESIHNFPPTVSHFLLPVWWYLTVVWPSLVWDKVVPCWRWLYIVSQKNCNKWQCVPMPWCVGLDQFEASNSNLSWVWMNLNAQKQFIQMSYVIDPP